MSGLPEVKKVKFSRKETVGKIVLTKGKFALVDDEDFEWLNKWKWTCDDKNDYAFRGEYKDGIYKCIKMHRFIMGVSKEREVDHIDGNGLNNLRSNLRVCNNFQQAQNRRKQKMIRGTSCTSVYKGVSINQYKDTKKWVANIKHKGKVFYLGIDKTELEAAKKYNDAAKKLFKEFAHLNII